MTLAGASSSACIVGSCNCPNFESPAVVVPAALDVQITASGSACPGGARCEGHAEGDACTQWRVPFTHAGNCMVSAQAADGQQATLSLSVEAVDLGCCGTGYRTDPPGALLSFPNFSVADAGTPDGP